MDETLESRLQQLRNALRQEQDTYILAITGENDPKHIQQIKERIATLQNQLANLSARSGYTGL